MKWIKRGSLESNIKCNFVASRKSAISETQDGILMEKGLSYEKVFSVNTIQFGLKLESVIKAKIAKSINFDNLNKAMLDAGTPPEVAKARIAAMIDSFSINAGTNEAVRAYGIKTAGLADNFWGTDDVDEKDETPIETVDITC